MAVGKYTINVVLNQIINFNYAINDIFRLDSRHAIITMLDYIKNRRTGAKIKRHIVTEPVTFYFHIATKTYNLSVTDTDKVLVS